MLQTFIVFPWLIGKQLSTTPWDNFSYRNTRRSQWSCITCRHGTLDSFRRQNKAIVLLAVVQALRIIVRHR